ncbi:hypothetical protein IWQ60_012618, partial [Tieghemiomyces parasiticus]
PHISIMNLARSTLRGVFTTVSSAATAPTAKSTLLGQPKVLLGGLSLATIAAVATSNQTKSAERSTASRQRLTRGGFRVDVDRSNGGV